MAIHRVGFGEDADIQVPRRARFALADVPVASRMTRARGLATVAAAARCDEAEALAQARGVRHLLVTEGDGLVGVLCRCDLHPPAGDDRVAAHMAREVYALDLRATLGEAAAALAHLHVGCLPVLDGEAVAGVLTRGDLRRLGVPERLLGARQCASCGSIRGVRAWTHGLDYCLDCLDLLEQMHPGGDYGEGD